MTIASRQNEPRSLDWLAAQRHNYTVAKRIFGLQVFLAGPLALAGSLWLLFDQTPKPYIALWGFVFAASDLLIIAPMLQRLRDGSARIQEAFDTYVLNIEWNAVKVGRPPDPEDVLSLAEAYAATERAGTRKTVLAWVGKPISSVTRCVARILSWFGVAPSKQGLADWYPTAVDRVPDQYGRIICQRSNCVYDMRVRNRYAIAVLLLMIAVAVAIVVVPMANGFTVKDMVLTGLVPAAPLLLLGVRNFRENRSAVDRSKRLKDALDRTLADVIAGKADAGATSVSRQIQDEIFEHRRSSPLVFDSVYNAMRNGIEGQVNATAEQLVEQVQRALGR